jgi:hypothetical protein
MAQKKEISKTEQRLKVRQAIADQARMNGMENTYKYYMEDIAMLKSELKKKRSSKPLNLT